jgi:hypothetical protein
MPDPDLDVISASLPYITSGDTLIFELGDVASGNCSKFDVVFFLACAASVNSDYCVEAIISSDSCLHGMPPHGFNFKDIHCSAIIMAIDPNDKIATPAGAGHDIPKDTTLDYMIRFQNTGNDTAFHVIIRDTLSSLLDPTS